MTTATDWLERIRALPLPPRHQGDERVRRARALDHDGGAARRIPSNIELDPRPRLPGVRLPRGGRLRGDPAGAARGRDPGRVRRHAARAGQRAEERAALARTGQGRRRRRTADREPAGGGAHRAARIPTRKVVFFVAGFETTTAPVAALIAQGIPDNLLLLLSGRLTWPAVAMLLDSGEPGFDALIAPGHVATVMGPEEWDFVTERARHRRRGRGLHAGVAAGGDLFGAAPVARGQVFPRQLLSRGRAPGRQRDGAGASWTRRWTSSTRNWRGIGIIPQSGFALKPRFARARCAQRSLPSYTEVARKRAGEMPPGCDCAHVVLGKIYPNECRLFGLACTPRKPVGPCMVSDEGACRIWWSNGVRENVWAGRKASGADGSVSRIARRPGSPAGSS